MARRWRFLLRIGLFSLLVLLVQTACTLWNKAEHVQVRPLQIVEEKPQDSIEILVGTFLGNECRNYYGDFMDTSLQLTWKYFLGKGTTIVTKEKGVEEWYGAGWTGQPLLVREKDQVFLIQGCYDHHLKKLDAATGTLVWQYAYDDILKGTGTIYKNDRAQNPEDRFLILQGSRIGVQNSQAAPHAYSYRAISYLSGREYWRMDVKRGPSYSRDVDGSALLINDTAYLGLENASFVRFDPQEKIQIDSFAIPNILQELPLYAEQDRAKHGGNLVTESSPARLGNHLYITSGSGHVYGYNLQTKTIDWDFVTGSDMDGSPVVTSDSCLLVTVEKQYISGHGGVFKLDPRQDPDHAVVWYQPTGDYEFSSWKGGVIGSVGVNDFYNSGNYPTLAAFTGIDGVLRVVNYCQLKQDSLSLGPDAKARYPQPKTIFETRIGPSISTPILVGNKLIAAGYNGIHLFQFDSIGQFTKLAFYPGIFEASPVVNHGQVFIASRDGYLYCLGKSVDRTTNFQPQFNIAQATPKTTLPKPVAKQTTAPIVVQKPTRPKPTVVAAVKPIEKPTSPKPTPIAAVKPVEKPIAAKTSTLVQSDTQAACNAIAGVFKSEANAKRCLALWKKRKYQAVVIQNPIGLYYVSVAQAKTEQELEGILQTLRSDFATDAWIWVNPNP